MKLKSRPLENCNPNSKTTQFYSKGEKRWIFIAESKKKSKNRRRGRIRIAFYAFILTIKSCAYTEKMCNKLFYYCICFGCNIHFIVRDDFQGSFLMFRFPTFSSHSQFSRWRVKTSTDTQRFFWIFFFENYLKFVNI